MAAKTYEIAFKLAGQMSQKFSKTFEAAKNTVKGFSTGIDDLNKQAAQVKNVVKLHEEVAKSSKDYIQAKQRVAELGKQISNTKEPTKKLVAEFEQAKKATQKAKEALEKKRESLKNVEKTADTAGQSLKQLTERQKQLEQQSEKARKALEKQAEVQEQLEEAAKRSEKIKGVASFGNTALLAGGAAAGAGAGAILKLGSETTAALNQMQALTGASAQEMEALNKSAMALYKNGIGENFAEVTSSLAAMKQATGLVGDELERTTKSASILGKTFGFDINESARTSAALIKNFGITGEKAFDLIAYAAQNGANKNGDLLDTFNEYSVHYKALGFSAEQFAQHLVAGAESGAWSIDKVGDMMKEFTIRSKDASDKTQEAFESLGLSGGEMTEAFAQGGATAQEAFFKVVSALNAMEDPVEKNAIGVSLFGTMFEDLEANSLEAMLSLKNASLDTAGAVSKIGDLQKADLGSQIGLIARQFQTALTPAAQEAAGAISKKMPEIKQAINGLVPSIQKFAKSFTDNMPTIVASISSAIQSAAKFAQIIMNNWSWLAPVLGTLLKAFLAFKAIAYVVLLANNLKRAYLGLKGAVLLLTSAQTKAKLATLATNAAMVAQKVGMVALKGVQLACAIATKAVTAATWLFSAALWANPITWVVALIVGLIAAIVLLVKHWDKVKAAALWVWEGIKVAWGYIADFTVKVFNGVKDTIAGIFSSLAGIVKAPINGVIGIVNKAISGINGISFTVPDWVPGIGGKGWSGLNIPAIPMLASGGIATAPTLAMIGEGREEEAVLPLSKLDSMLGGGNGGVINVNFSPNINVSGGGTDVISQLNRGLRSGANDLKKELQKLLQEQRRVSYT